MRTHLQGLRAEGHRRTLVVRRIHRLGLDSPEKLRAHFEQYGAVEAVLVTHSHVRSERRSRPAVTTRIRPAHLGFVVMGGAEGAEAAVGDGEAHVVLGSPIEVQRFVPHRGEPAGAPRDSDEAADASEGMADDEQDSATESASPSPRRAAAQ
ncbi:unnamed protein product [Prorocentrum cordatum]|uniref:Uncharacterized protein n=1 Tax=Prorocentrum cordatum TaxID=2364126 RepID=A0ABN9SA74_9DINO|nr:unnamed protein product [Polarella glacialis]